MSSETTNDITNTTDVKNQEAVLSFEMHWSSIASKITRIWHQFTWIHCVVNIKYDKVPFVNLFKNIIWILQNSKVTGLSKKQTFLTQDQIA